MTEVIFVSVFFLALGYFASKFFKGLNPFKMIFGFAIIFPVSLGLMEADNNWYTVLFIGGILLNFGNPFSGLFGAYNDYRVHKMYEKSINNQVNEATENLNKKAEDIRKEEEELRRQKADFNRKRAESSAKNTNKQTVDEAMKLLGLVPGFNKTDLKKAYKRESMKYHPDRGAGQPEHIKNLMSVKFKEVVSAYNYLEGL